MTPYNRDETAVEYVARLERRIHELEAALREIISAYGDPDDIEPEERMIEIARNALRCDVGAPAA